MRTLRLQNDIEFFIAGIGAVQSLFMGFYSLFERKRDFRNVLLFLFFIAITVRIAKSILWVYLDSSPLWLINFGFAAHAISGPALFLYAGYYLFLRKWSWWNLLHFVPGLLLLISLGSVSLDGFWYSGGYQALLFHQMAYSVGSLVLLGIYFLRKNPQLALTKAASIWIIALTLGTALLQFLYFSNYILGITPYMLGPIVYLPLVYFLAFLLFKNPALLHYKTHRKSQNIKLSGQELTLAANRLEKIMETRRLFLDPDCTMTKVAKVAKMPTYLVSHVVNHKLGRSFPDFLNGYRIASVKDKLIDPDYRNLKIANIAYDCGFNTLSSFNKAFKKATGTTPTQFQQRNTSV